MPQTFSVGPIPQIAVPRLSVFQGVPVDMRMVANAYDREATRKSQRDLYDEQRRMQAMGQILKSTENIEGLVGLNPRDVALEKEVADRRSQLEQTLLSPDYLVDPVKQRSAVSEFERWMRGNTDYQKALQEQKWYQGLYKSFTESETPDQYSVPMFNELTDRYTSLTEGFLQPGDFVASTYLNHDLNQYTKEFYKEGGAFKEYSAKYLQPGQNPGDMTKIEVMQVVKPEKQFEIFSDWLMTNHPTFGRWALATYGSEERVSQAIWNQVLSQNRGGRSISDPNSDYNLYPTDMEMKFGDGDRNPSDPTGDSVPSTLNMRNIVPIAEMRINYTPEDPYRALGELDKRANSLVAYSKAVQEDFDDEKLRITGLVPGQKDKDGNPISAADYLLEMLMTRGADAVKDAVVYVDPETGLVDQRMKEVHLSRIVDLGRTQRTYKQTAQITKPAFEEALRSTYQVNDVPSPRQYQDNNEDTPPMTEMTRLGFWQEDETIGGITITRLKHEMPDHLVGFNPNEPMETPFEGPEQGEGWGLEGKKSDYNKIKNIQEDYRKRLQKAYDDLSVKHIDAYTFEGRQALDERTGKEFTKDKNAQQALNRSVTQDLAGFYVGKLGDPNIPGRGHFLKKGRLANHTELGLFIKDEIGLDYDQFGGSLQYEFEAIVPDEAGLQMMAAMKPQIHLTHEKIKEAQTGGLFKKGAIDHIESINAKNGYNVFTWDKVLDANGDPTGDIIIKLNTDVLVPFDGWSEDWAQDFAENDGRKYIDVATMFMGQIPIGTTVEFPGLYNKPLTVTNTGDMYEMFFQRNDGNYVEKVDVPYENAENIVTAYKNQMLEMSNLTMGELEHISFAPTINYDDTQEDLTVEQQKQQAWSQLDNAAKAGMVNLNYYLGKHGYSGAPIVSMARHPNHKLSQQNKKSPHIPGLGRGGTAFDIGLGASDKKGIGSFLEEKLRQGYQGGYLEHVLYQLFGTYNVKVLGPFNDPVRHANGLHFEFT